jgi:hypothetical protein
MLVMVLHVILMFQQAPCKPLNVGDAIVGQIVRYVDGCPRFVTPEPFDVPPVETKAIFGYSNCKSVPGENYVVDCKLNYYTTGMACTDKSRFLLMSEDGIWHCLKLNQ